MKKKKKEALIYSFVEFLLARKPAYAAEMLRPSYLASAREFLARPAQKEPRYLICGWCDVRFTIGWNDWFCSQKCCCDI